MKDKRPPLKSALPVAALLKELLQQRGMEEKFEAYRAWELWDEVVGQRIAAKARPVRVRDTTLEIQVEHPVWMQQLQLMKGDILARLNERLGTEVFTDLYLRRGKVSAPPARTVEAEPRPRPDLSPEERQRIDQSLTDLDDDTLRHRLQALFTLQAQLDKERED